MSEVEDKKEKYTKIYPSFQTLTHTFIRIKVLTFFFKLYCVFVGNDGIFHRQYRKTRHPKLHQPLHEWRRGANA